MADKKKKKINESKEKSFVFNDGGRAAAGYKGSTGDCVVRAIAIATGQNYQMVYEGVNQIAGKKVARTGVPMAVSKKYLASLGWVWRPTMFIGQGCQVHLTPEELPSGRIIVRVSRHFVAMINGVMHDTFDPSRRGSRCVYGYFIQEGKK